MDSNGLTVRVGGDSAAGGIVTTGEIFARVAASAGWEVYTTRTIPSEIKGGHVMFQVRVAPEQLWSQGDDLDMLVAFDQESIERYYGLIRRGGILLYNANDGKPRIPNGVVHHALPLNDLARSINFQRGRNIIAIGAMVKLFALPYDKACAIVERQLGRKKEILNQNLLALKTGYDSIDRNGTQSLRPDLCSPGLAKDQPRLVLNGNQVLSIGAIAAGCRFYAGYPITPASDVMEFLAAEMPKIDGTIIQAEDEIAAIGMALGASFTGVRSMTATSGPGLSLMVELIGHAAITEIPLVVVDVQRAGPSSGMPSKVSQGDLDLAVFGAHDHAPRIVIAPVSVEDNFYQMIHAFNLAEKYQTPVIVLSDQDMSVRVQTIPPFDMTQVTWEPRLLAKLDGNGQGVFERYADTPSGISPTSLPGIKGGQYVAEGIEHDPQGQPCYTPENHIANMRKRARKIQAAVEDAERWDMFEEWGDDAAALGIIGWGSTIGPVHDAVTRALAEGMKIAILYPKLLFPLPIERIRRFVAKRKTIIVPEMNFTGQFARLIERELKVDLVSLLNYSGIPFSAREIYEKVVEEYATLEAQ